MIAESWKLPPVGAEEILSRYGMGVTKNQNDAWPSIAHLTPHFLKNTAYRYRHLQTARPSGSSTGSGHFPQRKRVCKRLLRNISGRALNYFRLSLLRNGCRRHWEYLQLLFGSFETNSGFLVGSCSPTSDPDLKQARNT